LYIGMGGYRRATLCAGHESRDFDFYFRPLIDQARNVEQGRGREISSKRIAPGRTDARSGRSVLVAAGQIPCQADNVLRSGPGLRKQLDDPLQRDRHLRRQIGLILALFVAAGLAGKHDPSASTIDLEAMRKTARLRPFGGLQDTHQQFSMEVLWGRCPSALGREGWS
jgi:hypothetical protein